MQSTESIKKLDKVENCRNQHITITSRSFGSSYKVRFCEFCQAHVHAMKNRCLCCRKEIEQKHHYIKLQRVLKKAIKDYSQEIEDYKIIPNKNIAEIDHDRITYHIPIKFLILYQEHDKPKEILPLIEKCTITIKKKCAYFLA